jgi:hypothetical protein
MEDRNGRIEFDPIFTIGIIGKCKIETIQDIKDFFSTLEGFETIFVKTTKGKKLWIQEEGEY